VLGSGFVPETAGDALEDRRGDPDSRTGVVDLRAHCDRAVEAQPATLEPGLAGIAVRRSWACSRGTPG
jgi:hypothetical protein